MDIRGERIKEFRALEANPKLFNFSSTERKIIAICSFSYYSHEPS